MAEDCGSWNTLQPFYVLGECSEQLTHTADDLQASSMSL